MTLYISVIASINLIIIFYFGRALRKPLILLIFWWYFWLCISTLSISGLYTPSAEVYAIYILMLISATFGALLFYSQKIRFNEAVEVNKSCEILYREIRVYNLLLKIINYIAAPVVIYFFLKSLYVMLTLDDISVYRNIVFATGEVDSVVFGTGTAQFIYNLTISNLVIIGVFVGASALIVNGGRKLFVISSILFSMEAIMMLGRFNFYIIFISIIIIMTMKKGKNVNIRKFIAKLLIFIFIPMILIGFQRSDSDIEDQIKTYALEYHTLGFSIFDADYHDSESMLNTASASGFASFGVVEQLAFVLIRRIDSSFKASSILVGDELNNKRLIGEKNQIYNAYGTIIYSLYYDSGLLYIIFFPFFWGYALMRSTYLAKRYDSIYQYSLILIFSYIGFFGIFQSLLLGSFWLYILILIVLFKFNIIKIPLRRVSR